MSTDPVAPPAEEQPDLVPRDVSWLSFNGRVLQEAQDPELPLLERLSFLAIFSSNLDEFFRVRVAALRTVLRLKKKKRRKLGLPPRRLLRQIYSMVTRHQEQFGRIWESQIVPGLASKGIHLVDERTVPRDLLPRV